MSAPLKSAGEGAGKGARFSAGGSLQRLLVNHAALMAVQRGSAAAGAGLALALTCDMIVAARDAVLAASCSNVALSLDNISPDNSLSWHLPRERRQLVRNLHHANASIGITDFLAKQMPACN